MPWDSVIKAAATAHEFWNAELIEPALDQRISRMTDPPRYAGGGDSSAPLAKRARVEDKPERGRAGMGGGTRKGQMDAFSGTLTATRFALTGPAPRTAVLSHALLRVPTFVSGA
eukprot:2016957-Amphidinium_carterae.1